MRTGKNEMKLHSMVAENERIFIFPAPGDTSLNQPNGGKYSSRSPKHRHLFARRKKARPSSTVSDFDGESLLWKKRAERDYFFRQYLPQEAIRYNEIQIISSSIGRSEPQTRDWETPQRTTSPTILRQFQDRNCPFFSFSTKHKTSWPQELSIS